MTFREDDSKGLKKMLFDTGKNDLCHIESENLATLSSAIMGKVENLPKLSGWAKDFSTDD